MDTKSTFQFTTSTLLSATSFVAFVLVLLPLVCDVSIEIVMLAALTLCLATSIADQVPPLRIKYLRRSLSVLLAIVATGLIVQVLRGKASFNPSALLALTISIAFLSNAVMPLGNYRIAWSTMGCMLLTAIIALRIYQTSSQRFFVNRHLTNGYGSETFQRDGVVSYNLYSQMHPLRRRSPMEIETLFDALDVEAHYRPVTKWRMFCGTDKIDSLSFAFATAPTDWTKLRGQSQLESINFDFLKISSDEIKSLESLTELDQLAFFSCDLPTNFLRSCREVKNLQILQVVDCKVNDLADVSTLKGLRRLILHKTKLSQSDLNEIAMVNLLTDLDLQDTNLTAEDFAFFATQLQANSSRRLGPFRCVVTYDPKIAKGLAALVKSGAIIELVLANFASSAEDLKFLRAVNAKVTITPLPIEESGTKR